MRHLLIIPALWAMLSGPVQACKLALVLAIDVSSSIDIGEYKFQISGLTEALRDPAIGDILLLDQVALTVVQWSGVNEQRAVIPWRRMLSRADLREFTQQVRGLDRAWESSNTAVGDAIAFSVEQFAAVPDCARQVIDVSGDGGSNAGIHTGIASRRAAEMGIQINGIAIDIVGRGITGYYERYVRTRDGFVITSQGFSNYPASIRKKLLRELIKPTS